MRIEQITAFLYSLKPRGIRFGLENTRLVLERLGNPQDNFKVIHIAGSNGKGSTAAFLDSILQRSGSKVGLYTSPHLNHYRERFRVAGVNVSDRAIELAAERLLSEGLGQNPRDIANWVTQQNLVEKMNAENWYNQRGGTDDFCRLTFFECTTILAVLIFAELGVDLAIMECGMGGRLDATNVFTPVLSMITPIHLEHTEWLGDTIAAIASEKAAIIKPDIPVVCGRQVSEAAEVIVEQASTVGAPLSMMFDDFEGWGDWQAAYFRTPSRQLGPIRLGLAGVHQIDNAAMAVGGLDHLAQAGIEVSDHKVEQGLAKVNWPARFERFGPDGEWIVDGAHNPDGVRALAAATKDTFGDQPVQLVFGVLGEKDAAQMLSILEPLSERIELVFPQDARGRDPLTLKSYIKIASQIHTSVSEALDSLAAEPGSPVLIAGSLTIAGEARTWLEKREIGPFCHPTT